MIEVRVPKEIKEYKPKFLFGLTVRQVICTGLALLICVPLYYFGQEFINEDLLGFLVMLIAAPFVLIGFFQYNQMNFETFLIAYIRMQINNQRRPYQEVPIFASIRTLYLAEQRREILKKINEQKKQKKQTKG